VRRSVLLLIVVLASIIPAAEPAAAGTVTGTLVFTVFSGPTTSDTGIYLMPAAGGSPEKISGNQALRPRWAPNGSGLAYVGQFGSIRWIDADGTNDHLLLRQDALPTHFPHAVWISWSPDATRLLLTLRSRHYRHVRLYIADLATKRVHLLARGADDGDWSSTGRLVATRLGNVVTMDADGTNRTIIYRRHASWLRWSPDGSALTFTRTSSADVFVMGADGADPTNLTTSKAPDYSPDWSPDGTMIVWSRGLPGDLFEMQADGTGIVQVTSTKHLDEYEPDWTA
jgi:TolB protein